MRYLLAGALGLALLAPAWPDDKPKADAPPAKPKTVKDQIDDLGQAFQKEMVALEKEFRAAKTPEEKEKIKDKALNQVSVDCAKKMLAVAVANPKDPAVIDALEFVCAAPGEKSAALVPEAVKIMLREHAGSEHLIGMCQAVKQRDDGEKLLREIRTKSTNPGVKAQAGYYLAEALQEKDDATAAQTKEAEKLLVEFVAAAKTVKGIPPDMAEEAEGMLKLFVGKPAPASTAKDLDDKAVALADFKGKVVVLDFWFTECGWCIKMIPHERELVKKNAGKPFVLVSVSADPRAKMVKDFVEKEPMPWTHWFAGQEGAIVKAWRVQGFPTMYVIDAKGIIRGKIVGGGPESEKKLDALVEKLVKEAS